MAKKMYSYRFGSVKNLCDDTSMIYAKVFLTEYTMGTGSHKDVAPVYAYLTDEMFFVSFVELDIASVEDMLAQATDAKAIVYTHARNMSAKNVNYQWPEELFRLDADERVCIEYDPIYSDLWSSVAQVLYEMQQADLQSFGFATDDNLEGQIASFDKMCEEETIDYIYALFPHLKIIAIN